MRRDLVFHDIPPLPISRKSSTLWDDIVGDVEERFRDSSPYPMEGIEPTTSPPSKANEPAMADEPIKAYEPLTADKPVVADEPVTVSEPIPTIESDQAIEPTEASEPTEAFEPVPGERI